MVMMMKEEEEVSQHTLIYLLPQLKWDLRLSCPSKFSVESSGGTCCLLLQGQSDIKVVLNSKGQPFKSDHN
jgi:hypothetical protein